MRRSTPVWSSSEDAILLEAISNGMSMTRLLARLPGRSKRPIEERNKRFAAVAAERAR